MSYLSGAHCLLPVGTVNCVQTLQAFISDLLWDKIQLACAAEFKLAGKVTYPPACQALLTEAGEKAGAFYVYGTLPSLAANLP
jgi:hypothetical protein